MRRTRSRYMIDCPFKGCGGTIDLTEEFANWPYRGRTPFLVHTIVCRKCGNSAGSMELGASFFWITHPPKRGKQAIFDPKTKKEVTIKGKDVPKRYLKKWAR